MLEFIRSTYFQGLLSSFSFGVILLDAEGRAYAINDAASAILEKPRQQCIGLHWTGLLAGTREMEEVHAMIQQVKNNLTKSGPVATTYAGNNGSKRYLSLSASILIYYEKIFGIALELSDITDIIRFHEREKEILEEKSLIQQERSNSLKKFSLSLAHQIRNPTASMGGLSRLLLKRNDCTNDNVKYLKTIFSCCRRLEEIVAAVDEYTAISAQIGHQVPVSTIVSRAKSMIYDGQEYSLAKVQVKIDVEDQMLSVDPDLLISAITEVLHNSVDAYEGKPGIISIKGHPEENEYVLEISDCGLGIQTENLPYLFDPFFTTRPDKIGMGLCKVKRIIDEHGGKVSVTMLPESETVVAIRLPVRENN
jgi:nitrogen fixation/metabolism regulation signal transduction histidine kinase